MTTEQAKEIAVLMTCFNRRDTTLACLRSLAKQELPTDYRLRVFLTDDGSSDGTGEAVRREFPLVAVLQGDGNLYWVGGTMMAWDAARPSDFYLWLNDDVRLQPGAIGALIDVYEAAANPATIVAGATCDPDVGKTCTGGLRRRSWHDVRVMEPTDAVQQCDSMAGNIVLIPRCVEDRIGALDTTYTHFFADGDYGMRARKAGVDILLAPGHLGACRLNPLANTSFDPKLSIRQRWQKMFGPKGYRPPREWWSFVQAHAPRPKLMYWMVPYVLFGFESVLGGKIRLRRHVKAPMKVS